MKKIFYIIIILVLLLPTFFATNEILSLEGKINNDNKVEITFHCEKEGEIKIEILKNVLVHEENILCRITKNTETINKDLNSGEIYEIKLSVENCSNCNTKSIFLVTRNQPKQTTIPDNNILLGLLITITTIILLKKNQIFKQ